MDLIMILILYVIGFTSLLAVLSDLFNKAKNSIESALGFIKDWEEKNGKEVKFITASKLGSFFLDKQSFVYSVERYDAERTKYGEGICVRFWKENPVFTGCPIYIRDQEYLFDKKAFFDFEEKETIGYLPEHSIVL
jgi:hypothetical protein